MLHACAVRTGGPIATRAQYIRGEGEPAIVTLKVRIRQNNTNSHWVRYGDLSGENELPFVTKVTGGSEIRTPHLFGDRCLIH